MTMCNVIRVIRSDQPMSLLWFYSPQICFHQAGFQQQQAAVFSEKALINSLYTHYLPSTKQQTHTVGEGSETFSR